MGRTGVKISVRTGDILRPPLPSVRLYWWKWPLQHSAAVRAYWQVPQNCTRSGKQAFGLNWQLLRWTAWNCDTPGVTQINSDTPGVTQINSDAPGVTQINYIVLESINYFILGLSRFLLRCGRRSTWRCQTEGANFPGGPNDITRSQAPRKQGGVITVRGGPGKICVPLFTVRNLRACRRTAG
jgi:hypothetical protein